MDKKIEKLIRDSLSGDEGFMKKNNYVIITLEEELVEMEAKVTKSSMNPYGFAHGGFIFGLADSCAGILVSASGRKAVTTNASVIYLKKVSGDKLVAKAKYLKKGKTISNVEVEMFDETESIVSIVTLEFCYIE